MSIIHHIGIVTADIAESVKTYRCLGMTSLSEVIIDEIQKVKVAFIGNKDFMSIELVEPLTPDSPVTRFLNRGGGLHHLCYEVPDITKALILLRQTGFLVIQEPLPAAAFHFRKIAFFLAPNKTIIEILEKTEWAQSQK